MPIEGLDYLGKGVDIFSHAYRQPPGQRRIVDLTDDLVEKSTIASTRTSITYGSSFAEFIETLAVQAGVKGSYGGFSGSIASKFARASTQSTSTQFLNITTMVSGKMLSIGEDLTVLQKHLNADFKRSIEEDDPKDLFAAYGTHVAAKVHIGGMAEFSCRTSETSSLTRTEFELAARAKYKKLGAEVEGSTSVTTTEQANLKHVEESTNLDVRGGDPTARQSLGKGEAKPWETWAASVSQSPAFLGFAKDGLIPIWRLATNPERRRLIEAAFKRYAAVNFSVRVFSHTGVKASHPHARITIPPKHKLLSGGAIDNWSGDGNLLTASFPVADNTWEAFGKDHKYGCDATITVFALAIYDPDELWEVSIAHASSPPTSHPTASVKVDPGYCLVGGGAKVEWLGDGNLLTASYANSPDTWAASSKDHAFPDAAALHVYAVGLRCKLPEIRIESRQWSNAGPPSNRPEARVSPGVGFTMVGGGAQSQLTDSCTLLTASYPGDPTTWIAKSKDHIYECKDVMSAHVIGLKVWAE